MKSGDIVKIYEDPVTKQKLEGEAKLNHFIAKIGLNIERWQVIFIDDKYKMSVGRFIYLE